jgi:hypothetical protein
MCHLVINVCNHICDYNVESREIVNVTIVCDYYMFQWKSKMKLHFFIQYCEWIIGWMKT